MLVEDLIRELKKLPKDSTVGIIDTYDYRVFKDICLMTNKEIIDDNDGNPISIGKIEERSHKDNVCDYYVVWYVISGIIRIIWQLKFCKLI